MRRQKPYTVSILLLLVTLCSTAQHSINALQLDSGYWKVNKITGGPSGPGPSYNYYYKLCGDTTINSIPYKRLFAAIENLNGPPQALIYQPHGYFRQDPVTKCSYFRQMTVNTDSLIMDYNLNVGDTIKRGFYSSGLSQNMSVIIKTDSLILGNIRHKVLYTDTTLNAFYPPGVWFLEGVGNVCGFLEPITIPLSGYATFLQNFDQSYSCDDLASIQDLQGMKNLFVYPNPVSNELHVATPLFVSKLIISNAAGKQLKVFTPGTDFREFSVPVSELSRGIYYSRFVFTDGSSITSSFIKE